MTRGAEGEDEGGAVRPGVPGTIQVASLTLGAFLVAAVLIGSCGPGGWGPRALHPYCYTDLGALYAGRGLSRGLVPYVHADLEYPVLTGLVAFLAALPAESAGGFFAANAIILAICGVVVSLLLRRSVGRAVLYFAAAPTLVLYALLNWDLLAVALATGATYAFLRRRDLLCGALLGLGTAAKLSPGLLLVPYALERVRRGDRGRAARLVIAAAVAWLAANAPVIIASPEGWSFFFRFSSERPPTWGTLWSVACRALWRTTRCPGVAVINVLWPVAFALVAGSVWWATRRRAPDFPRWTSASPLLTALLLTSKVYSPRYSLWLLPWFAIVLPDPVTFVAFEVADLLVFLTEFSAQGARFGLDTFPRWTLDVAVLVRAAVLVLILLRFVRDAGSGAVAARAAAVEAVGS